MNRGKNLSTTLKGVVIEMIPPFKIEKYLTVY